MGRWGDSFFADDLASDVRGGFDDAVRSGSSPRDAAAGLLDTDLAREILDEFTEDDRDDMFWEESSGLIFAAAVLQLEHDTLLDETRVLALEAIEAEREAGADPGRLKLLSELEDRLASASA